MEVTHDGGERPRWPTGLAHGPGDVELPSLMGTLWSAARSRGNG